MSEAEGFTDWFRALVGGLGAALAFALVVRMALSWSRLSHDNTFFQIADSLAELMQDPVRRQIPASRGMDFSGPVALLLVVGVTFALRFLLE